MTEQPPIEEITRRIVEAFDPQRIVLFGSRARGDARADSDVDLMIEMNSHLKPLARATAVYKLLPDRSWAMDVIVYTPEEVLERHRHRYSFLNTIEREGKVLYAKSG